MCDQPHKTTQSGTTIYMQCPHNPGVALRPLHRDADYWLTVVVRPADEPGYNRADLYLAPDHGGQYFLGAVEAPGDHAIRSLVREAHSMVRRTFSAEVVKALHRVRYGAAYTEAHLAGFGPDEARRWAEQADGVATENVIRGVTLFGAPRRQGRA